MAKRLTQYLRANIIDRIRSSIPPLSAYSEEDEERVRILIQEEIDAAQPKQIKNLKVEDPEVYKRLEAITTFPTWIDFEVLEDVSSGESVNGPKHYVREIPIAFFARPDLLNSFSPWNQPSLRRGGGGCSLNADNLSKETKVALVEAVKDTFLGFQEKERFMNQVQQIIYSSSTIETAKKFLPENLHQYLSEE